MSRFLFDFKCPDGHVLETLVKPTVRSIECPCCGQRAERMLAAPRAQLEGITGAFPGAAMQWEKRRESHMAQERKNKEKHGTYK